MRTRCWRAMEVSGALRKSGFVGRARQGALGRTGGGALLLLHPPSVEPEPRTRYVGSPAWVVTDVGPHPYHALAQGSSILGHRGIVAVRFPAIRPWPAGRARLRPGERPRDRTPSSGGFGRGGS